MKPLSILALVLWTAMAAIPCQAGYKDQVKTWEGWSPPAHAVPEGQAPARDTGQVPETDASQAPLPAGYRVWQTRTQELLDQGRFLDAGAPGKALPEGHGTVDRLGAGVRLSDLQDLVISRNPGILAAVQAFAGELDGFDQVADLDAVLSRYATFTSGVMAGVGPMKGGAGMDPSFPFPARSALKTRIITENAALAALDLNMAVRDTVTSARKAFWNLGLVHEKRAILQETLDLFDHLYEIASTRYKTGKTSYQDVIEITIKKRVLKNRIATLGEQQKALEVEILTLMDLPRDTRLGTPETLALPAEIPGAASLTDQALKTRQELLRMDHAIARMEVMIQLAESMVLPPLDLGLSANRQADIATAGTWAAQPAFPDQGPQAATGAGQPKRPWFGSSGAWLAQTRKKLAALRHQRQNLETRTRSQVQSAWSSLDDAARTHDLYKGSILELSASALDVATREYEAGSISFTATAGAYNNWLNTRLSLATAKRDAAVSRADLQKTVGVSF